MDVYHYEDEPFLDQEPGVGNKVLHTERMSLVTWHFTKGHVGAMHTHPQEQVCYILKGEMEFVTEAGTVQVKAGDQVVFAGNEAHGSKALADSIILDIFSAVREDFRDKFQAMKPAQSI